MLVETSQMIPINSSNTVFKSPTGSQAVCGATSCYGDAPMVHGSRVCKYIITIQYNL